MARNLSELAEVFAGIDESGDMLLFFDEIFTASERRDISLRWQSMKLLRAGLSQRKVSERLGISLCKVTRGARVLKDRNSFTNKILSE